MCEPCTKPRSAATVRSCPTYEAFVACEAPYEAPWWCAVVVEAGGGWIGWRRDVWWMVKSEEQEVGAPPDSATDAPK